ncbi:formyltransferase family protein [Sediminibacterium goheungense]|uniref:Formyl transferase-like protein n=1 Tax=Sediminibacterium goheungense TaxID=1086393 RepID=A0A4V3C4F7_9BACT|nr:formyltransferase family protein [Sediminibacterium goheungense]TDO25688.1 formyl transferase-like protein [Sediminibacterium goheungense]
MKPIHSKYVERFNQPDWGAYYMPDQDWEKQETGLRIVLFGSTLGGMWVLESLKQLKNILGARITLVGLATDDARDPHARISLKKRIWHYFEKAQQHEMVDGIVMQALSIGMEVFTGNIKSAYFQGLLQQWKPDIIIMACFGQIVPPSVFNYPVMGMYNFHPSDLKNDIGAGPKPFEETLASRMNTTCVSLMGVTEIIDHGPLIGQSPAIRITGKEDEFFSDVLLTEEKVTSVFPDMTWVLVHKILLMQGTALPVEFTIDFDQEIDEAVKQRLLQPLSGKHSAVYPFPDMTLFSIGYKTLQV